MTHPFPDVWWAWKGVKSAVRLRKGQIKFIWFKPCDRINTWIICWTTSRGNPQIRIVFCNFGDSVSFNFSIASINHRLNHFIPSPQWDEWNSLLEVERICITWHCSKPCVNLVLTIHQTLDCPGWNVILEDTFGWWRRSGVKHEKMLQCGRSCQKGSMGWRLTLLNCIKSPLIALSKTLSTFFWVLAADIFSAPSFSLPTLHLEHQFCLLYATKHCSGWSATYANGIGNTQQILLLEQIILPSFHKWSQQQFHTAVS